MITIKDFLQLNPYDNYTIYTLERNKEKPLLENINADVLRKSDYMNSNIIAFFCDEDIPELLHVEI